MTVAAGTMRVTFPDLHGFIARVLQAVGLPESDARRVAELMAEADARGADGHGVFRLPQYVKRIQSGGINTRPNIRIFREQAATALVDGDNAMGHLVMSRAAEVAIEKARTRVSAGWERATVIMLDRRSFMRACRWLTT